MKTYLRHKIQNVLEVKELIALEYLDFEGKYKNYEESHGFWELCFVESGCASVLIDDNRISLKQGELLLIAPDKKHAYTSIDKTAKVFVVCFESFSHSLKSLDSIRFSIDEQDEYCLKQIIFENKHTFQMNDKDLLEQITNPNFGGQQVIILQLEHLLIRLIRRLSENQEKIIFLSGEQFHADLTRIVFDYFEDNIYEKISLNDIAKKVNYSRSFICKIFKQQTGESLLNSFNRLKIEKAKLLLKDTNLSATEISDKLGFSEDKYFGAVFKKFTGLSPMTYKKVHYGKTN